MGLWNVRGGNRLYGTVSVQGSRNGSLALLAGSLLHPGVTVLERVPQVTDVQRFLDILQCLHCKVRREGDRVTIDASGAAPGEIPRSLTDGLRASMLFLGAMTARFGEACLPMPDSCVLGPRPLDLHVDVLSRLGAEPELDESCIRCRGSGCEGALISLPIPSVGATEQAMLMACGATGETTIHGCAREPEVADLAQYLTRCGHEIQGIGTDTMTIYPGGSRTEVYHRVLPDRIAAGTLLCAVAACGGKITLQDIFSPHLQPILDGLAEMGCNIQVQENAVTVSSQGALWSPAGETATGAYPRFPTDLLPQFAAACLRADGVTVMREQVMPGRAAALKMLGRFGGDMSLTGDNAVVLIGVNDLHPAWVETRDVQTGAALLIAALQTPGESRIIDHGNIARGYAYLDAALRQLGAEISYID